MTAGIGICQGHDAPIPPNSALSKQRTLPGALDITSRHTISRPILWHFGLVTSRGRLLTRNAVKKREFCSGVVPNTQNLVRMV